MYNNITSDQIFKTQVFSLCSLQGDYYVVHESLYPNYYEKDIRIPLTIINHIYNRLIESI
jgi:hypothetical protein